MIRRCVLNAVLVVAVMVVGALILVLGLDLVKEAVWDARHRASRYRSVNDPRLFTPDFFSPQERIYHYHQHHGLHDCLGFRHWSVIRHHYELCVPLRSRFRCQVTYSFLKASFS